MRVDKPGKVKREDSTVVLKPFMVNDLELSGNELIAFAIIHGFSQDGKSCMRGGRDYISRWCHTTRRAASGILRRLESKNYITAHKTIAEDGRVETSYSVNFDVIDAIRGVGEKTSAGEESSPMGEESSPSAEETSPTLYLINKGYKRRSNGEVIVTFDDFMDEVISTLNTLTGSHYRSTHKDNRDKVMRLIRQDYSLDDFYTVIDKKCAEWMGTPMASNLKPSTLFAQSHFDNYLNQPDAVVTNRRGAYGHGPRGGSAADFGKWDRAAEAHVL